MTGPAPVDAPPHRRKRWLAAIAVLTVLVGGVSIVALSRTRAAAARAQAVQRTIRATLEEQGAALLRGDEAGWLRAADPSLVPQLRRLYANLHGFEVSAWLPRTAPPTGGGQSWSAEVQVRVCFARTACRRTADSYVPHDEVITARTRWRLAGGRAVLTGFDQVGPAGAVPWKQDALRFAGGTRTVVAAPHDGTQPAAWLPAAENAARAADRFATAAHRPGRYLIYLADPDDWDAAIGGDHEAAGFVDRTSEQTAFAVMDASGAPDERLLAHELGHIATLLGTLGGHDTWAIEGMAEYIAYGGIPVAAYPRLADARRHVARTAWTGRLDLPWSAEAADRSGLYAMAYLAVRCLGATYGDRKLAAFFTLLVHEGRTPDLAAPVFGVPWDRVQDACEPKIRAWLA
ncbi:hypothetical protein [Nucisporomicrobium flavum]|uniref:hypothetical protein n=1 Tax=Nucisporomicrobium flavum TaxID=2785915 RepID=UPI0018F6BD17|nr:hypothetical protein [Nucisporomicrobium flavum]